MGDLNLGLVELVFVFGAVAAFAGWQLWDVRRPPSDKDKGGSDDTSG